MKLLACLVLLYLALLLIAALTSGEAGVNTAPSVTSSVKDTHDAALGRLRVPAPASRSRHTEPPSRLDLLDWQAMARCESSGDPRAVSASGKYRGLYQFDADFWRTYGGLSYAKRPENATVREQTIVAQRGYAARGRAPWPFCGKRL